MDSYIYVSSVVSFLIHMDVYGYSCKNSFRRTCKFNLVVSIKITDLCILLIFETLGKQHLSQILEQTLDIISFMRVHSNWRVSWKGVCVNTVSKTLLYTQDAV